MADKPYVNETQTIRFEMWDKRISHEKPNREEFPNHPAWLTPLQVSQIIVKVTNPDLTVDTYLLTDDNDALEATDRPGEWRLRFLTNKGKGKYLVDIEGRTVDDYRIVNIVTVTAVLRK